MPTNKKDIQENHTHEELALMAVNLAGQIGWADVRLSDIAEEANISLAQLSRHFRDKVEVLCAYGRYVDYRTLDDAGAPDLEVSPRDRLFDILMARFDVLNDHRDGVASILHSLKTDPKQLVISLPYLGRSMQLMLEAAGLDANGLRGAVRVVGLKLIYLKTLKIWMDDESPDMAKTMAALDKALGKAENFAQQFGL